MIQKECSEEPEKNVFVYKTAQPINLWEPCSAEQGLNTPKSGPETGVPSLVQWRRQDPVRAGRAQKCVKLFVAHNNAKKYTEGGSCSRD